MIRKERGDYINANDNSNIQYLALNICNVQDYVMCVCVWWGGG